MIADLLPETQVESRAGRLQLAYGEWLLRHDRADGSREVLRPAAGTLDDIGAKPWAVRAREALRDCDQ